MFTITSEPKFEPPFLEVSSAGESGLDVKFSAF